MCVRVKMNMINYIKIIDLHKFKTFNNYKYD